MSTETKREEPEADYQTGVAFSGWQVPPESEPLLGTRETERSTAPVGNEWSFPETPLSNAISETTTPWTSTATPSTGSRPDDEGPWSKMRRTEIDRGDGGIYQPTQPEEWSPASPQRDVYQVGEKKDARKPRRRQSWLSRVAGVLLALFALMVLLAENDREVAGEDVIGRTIPVTEMTPDTNVENEETFPDISNSDLEPTPSATPIVPSPKASAPPTKDRTPNRVPALIGELDPTLLPPDIISTVLLGRDAIAVSFIDTNNFEVPGIKYEVRVVSALGVRVRYPAPNDVYVKGISSTRCTVEVRTILGERRSKPLIIRCGK
jgi:hypothetical protein